MYLYSVCALVVCCYLFPHIRKASPLQNLGLAWFYILDTVINTAYTTAFTVTWFLTVSANQTGQEVPNSPGKGTIGDTAGFTDPTHNVSSVDVVLDSAGGQGAVGVAVGTGASVISAATGSPSLGHGVSLTESLPSLIVIITLCLIRVYCIFIICAYARQVLRQHMSQYNSSSTTANALHIIITDNRSDLGTIKPFSEDTPEGQGWKGKLGRVMVKVGKNYWTGGKDDDMWARGLDGRFRMTTTKTPKLTTSGPPGTVERERRARSGTGPSVKPVILNLRP